MQESRKRKASVDSEEKSESRASTETPIQEDLSKRFKLDENLKAREQWKQYQQALEETAKLEGDIARLRETVAGLSEFKKDAAWQ